MMWKIAALLTLIGFAIAYPQSSKNQKTPAVPSYSITPAPSKGLVTPGSLNSASSVTPSGPVNPLNLTFVVSARGLPSKKKKFDPYVKLFHRKGATATGAAAPVGTDWTPMGQTDMLYANDDPDFNNVFSFIWTKGLNQMWHFEVKDHAKLGKDPAIGQADVNIDEYVLQKNQDVTIKLNDGGTLIIKKTTPVKFKLYARNVPKMDTFGGASDPFVEVFWRKGKDGNDTLLYTTKVIEDVEHADWDETIEFPNYQKGTNQYWHFKVNDKDSVSGNDFIGETLVEIDPFVVKRGAKVNKLSTDAANKATLTITPA